MRPQLKARRNVFFLLFSLLLHVAVVAFVFLYPISPQDFRKNQVFQSAEKKHKFEVTYLDQKEFDKKMKQIVNNEQANKLKNDSTKFLSQFDNKTDRQTVAKNVDTFFRSQSHTPSTESSKKNKTTSRKKTTPPKVKLSDLGLNLENLAKIEVAKTIKEREQESNQSKRASSNNDYVKDVASGDITNLNTAEYKYYGFYSRIRVQLEQYWSNELKSKSSTMYKKGRSIASGQELITNLEITIDQSGRIKKVAVVTTSGVREIDEAAISAFEKAGPFPNPPSEMVATGEAVLRWGFVVRS